MELQRVYSQAGPGVRPGAGGRSPDARRGPSEPGLSPPARYFPLRSGKYEVAAGLKALGTPFGNGEADARVFQIDAQFPLFRENRLRCRAERLGKYCLTQDYSPAVAAAVARFMAARLAADYPEYFTDEPRADGSRTLQCRLTGETLYFDPEMRLADVGTDAPVSPPYVDAFDALCSQVAEDIAVVSTAPGRGDWLSALHICSPSYWVPEEKIGQSFTAVHAPVPGIEPVNRVAGALVTAMVERGPYLRFVWGVATDRRLNHHIEPPPGVPLEEWRGRAFRPDGSGTPLWLRVERQVLHGLPEAGAALFAIRLSFIDGTEIRADPAERAALRSALLSMSPESRVYKGVSAWLEEVIAWLDEGE